MAVLYVVGVGAWLLPSVSTDSLFGATPRSVCSSGDGDATNQGAKSLDALQAMENPSNEWLPAWLLEEASDDAANAPSADSECLLTSRCGPV